MGFFDAISREVNYLRTGGRMTRRARGILPGSTRTVADLLERWVRETPNAPALYFEEHVISWKQLDQGAARYTRWAMDQGIGKGDAVAILMESRPEYIMAWFGLLKIGAIAALINANLTGAPLRHSLSISGARHVVLGSELGDAYLAAGIGSETPMVAWATGGAVAGANDLDAVLAGKSPAPIPVPFRTGLTAGDKALYIYTSGTTGAPKAANISHARMMVMMEMFAGAVNATSKDIMYDVLPLYHSSGGVCALGAVWCVGGAVVLRRKFSASQFWDDCARYRPTLFQYIGELCRYLLNAPPHPLEAQSGLRLAIGNGLRPEIWKTFQERFRIPKIVEFYGATEGNIALMNFDNKEGAIGRIPNYLRKRLPIRIVKFDVEGEQPVRDPATGFCTECAVDEVGEAIGKIDPAAPRSNFEGYSKGADTDKKLLRDVFEKGDVYFRSGDLLKRDAQGYFYFADRIGDTFRWKGENVATSEVGEALSLFPGVKEANVYGVKVGTLDGRAGMAAFIAGPDFDLAALPAYLERHLPAYARPLFLRRLGHEMDVTGTFKQRKVELVKEGFDPGAISDPVFWFDSDAHAYAPLDSETYAKLIAGEIQLGTVAAMPTAPPPLPVVADTLAAPDAPPAAPAEAHTEIEPDPAPPTEPTPVAETLAAEGTPPQVPNASTPENVHAALAEVADEINRSIAAPPTPATPAPDADETTIDAAPGPRPQA